jgi:TrmH family RNA methyltransferase
MLREITSLQHPLVKHLIRLRQNRDYREEHHSAAIEGKKMVAEVGAHQIVKRIFTEDLTLIPPNIHTEETIIVTAAIMKKISALHTSEGILAEVQMPENRSLKGMQWVIVCDGVNDPGNLGTLLRTALALGWEGALLLPNTCDPYNEKALRSAKGATFRLPLANGSWKEVQGLIAQKTLQPFVAHLEGMPLSEFKQSSGVLLVLGNEANGPSLQAMEACKKIHIPMQGAMDSLNVAAAGAIFMYALRN